MKRIQLKNKAPLVLLAEAIEIMEEHGTYLMQEYREAKKGGHRETANWALREYRRFHRWLRKAKGE